MNDAGLRVEPYGTRSLAVRGDSRPIRDQLKVIPAARWDAKEVAWIFPRSPLAARDLLRTNAGWNSSTEMLVTLASTGDPSAREDSQLDVPLPAHCGLPAWHHQTRGARWLQRHEAALLQYGMRTGKTRATLDALRAVEARTTVVLAPLNACAVWEEQAARYHPGYFRVLKLDGGSIVRRASRLNAETKAARAAGVPVLVALNYEAAWRLVMAPALLALAPDALVLDEIHRCKGPGAHQSRFAARLGRVSARRWGLSGTPLAHSPMDAYAVFRALDPAVFGESLGAFRARYAVMGGWNGHEVVGYRNLDEFRERYFSLTLAADRAVLDLPEAVHEDVVVEVPPEARRVHDELKREAVALLAGGSREVVASNVLTRLLRMCQVASGHVRTEAGLLSPEFGEETGGRVEEVHRAKEHALDEILADLDQAEPVVVFCRFRHDLVQVERSALAAGREYRELSGARRELDGWRSVAPRGAVLGCQYQAGSEGIDLSEASYCVLYDDVFSLSQSDQAIARVHGPGSRNRVVYFHLVARGTVDEYVRRTLKKRRDVLADLLDERKLGISEEEN